MPENTTTVLLIMHDASIVVFDQSNKMLRTESADITIANQGIPANAPIAISSFSKSFLG